MTVLKIVGATLCVGLGVAKAVGLCVILSDSDSDRTFAWIAKQSIYAISFIGFGIYLWVTRKDEVASDPN